MLAAIVGLIAFVFKLTVFTLLATVAYLLSRIHRLRARQQALNAGMPDHPVPAGTPVPDAGAAAVETQPEVIKTLPLDDLAARILADHPGKVELTFKCLRWTWVVVGVAGSTLFYMSIVLLKMLGFVWGGSRDLGIGAGTDDQGITSAWKDPGGVGYSDPLAYDYDPLGTIIGHEIDD